MLPWKLGCTPNSGVVTWLTNGKVTPPSVDLATYRESVPVRSAPVCLLVIYTMFESKLASHWRSSAGKVEPSGSQAQTAPPLLDVQVVLPPSQREVMTTLPLGSARMSSSPPPAPTPTKPRPEPAACVPSGSPR